MAITRDRLGRFAGSGSTGRKGGTDSQRKTAAFMLREGRKDVRSAYRHTDKAEAQKGLEMRKRYAEHVTGRQSLSTRIRNMKKAAK